jgi:VanZ family protein
MRFLPLLGLITFLFLLSHTPGRSLPEATLFGLDKLWHALAYASLAAAALWAWLPQVNKRPRQGLGAILLFCLLYGISDEFHQSFIPGRNASPADRAADVLGAALFLWCWWFYSARKVHLESRKDKADCQ